MPQDDPVAFTETFTADADKKAQWTGFLKRSGVPTSATLAEVVASIRAFLDEPLSSVRAGRKFTKTWSSGRWR